MPPVRLLGEGKSLGTDVATWDTGVLQSWSLDIN
jgi:hypothetical protein